MRGLGCNADSSIFARIIEGITVNTGMSDLSPSSNLEVETTPVANVAGTQRVGGLEGIAPLHL